MPIQDSLTGLLYSQSALREWLVHEFNRSERYGSPFTLVRIEIPELAQMDHAARKIAFFSIAKIAKENIRLTDICGRVGRTRLYVLMTGTGRSEADPLVERLESKLKSLKFLDKEQKEFTLTCNAEFLEFEKSKTQIKQMLDFLGA